VGGDGEESAWAFSPLSIDRPISLIPILGVLWAEAHLAISKFQICLFLLGLIPKSTDPLARVAPHGQRHISSC
jgi:hypothetical protein